MCPGRLLDVLAVVPAHRSSACLVSCFVFRQRLLIGCFVAGMTNGFRVFNADPLKEKKGRSEFATYPCMRHHILLARAPHLLWVQFSCVVSPNDCCSTSRGFCLKRPPFLSHAGPTHGQRSWMCMKRYAPLCVLLTCARGFLHANLQRLKMAALDLPKCCSGATISRSSVGAALQSFRPTKVGTWTSAPRLLARMCATLRRAALQCATWQNECLSTHPFKPAPPFS